MQTMTFRSQVGEDGVLRLNVPTGVTNTELEVVVVVQPLTVSKQHHTDSRRRFEQLRQQQGGRVFSDSTELLREDRQR
jgi:hypothetical protein